MTREVIETITFNSKPHYEVEARVPNAENAWVAVTNFKSGEAEVFETQHAAKEYAADYSKLYHRDTRIVRVSA